LHRLLSRNVFKEGHHGPRISARGMAASVDASHQRPLRLSDVDKLINVADLPIAAASSGAMSVKNILNRENQDQWQYGFKPSWPDE
jgi:hypothetical protein